MVRDRGRPFVRWPLETAVALVAVTLAVVIGSFNMLRVVPEIDDTFAGFLWAMDVRRDQGIVNFFTPSSWPAMQDGLDWVDRFEEIDGRPLDQAGHVFAEKEPGDPVTYTFVEGDGSRQVRSFPAERFTWSKFAESLGVVYAGALIYLISGAYLVARANRSTAVRFDRVPERLGWLLICVGVVAMTGSGVVVRSQLSDIVNLGNIFEGVLAVTLSGPILFSLAYDMLPAGSKGGAKIIRDLFGPWRWVPYVGALIGAAYTYLYLAEVGPVDPFVPGLILISCGAIAAACAAISRLFQSRSRTPLEPVRTTVVLPLLAAIGLVFLAGAIPWVVSAELVIPSSVLVPLLALVPLAIVYATLTGESMTEALREASRADRAALEELGQRRRQEVMIASLDDRLHGNVLADIRTTRLGIEALTSVSDEGTLAVPREDLESAAQDLKAVSSYVRREILDKVESLQGEALDTFPSPDDIRGMARAIAKRLKRNEPQVSVEIGDAPAWPISLQRIYLAHLRAMMSNSILHGSARSIEVSFGDDGGVSRMIVRDDGQGFDPKELERTPEKRFGLRAAQRFAARWAGRVAIDSRRGVGTTIVEELPLAPFEASSTD